MNDDDGAGMLLLAGSEPNRAVALATSLLERGTDEERLSALHALGLAHRNLRDPAQSVEYLRLALADAEQRQVDPNQQWAIRADLAVSITDAGEPSVGLDQIGGASGPDADELLRLTPHTVARVNHIRGLLHQRMGNPQEARACYRAALDGYGEHGDQLGLGHVLGNLGILTTYEGDIDAALELFDRAEEAYTRAGQELWVALTILNRGWARGCGGNLARALRDLAEAETRLRKLDVPDGLRVLSRGEVLLKAGLYSTARSELVEAVAEFDHKGLAIDRSETLILAAQAAELDGDLRDAQRLARDAISELDDQARPGWSAAARATAFGIRCRSGLAPADVHQRAEDLCRLLSTAGQTGMMPMVQLSAAWALTEQGDVATAERFVSRARPHCDRAETRSMLALCEARIFEALADTSAALTALDRGYRELESELELLGGVDIAALAAASVVRIVDVAKRLLAATDDTEAFLVWADRGRQLGTWRWPRLDDPEISRLLNRLRALSSNDGEPEVERMSTVDDLRRQIKELRWQHERMPMHGDGMVGHAVGTDRSGPPVVIDLTRADGSWFIGVLGTDVAEPIHRPLEADAGQLLAATRLARLFQTSQPPVQLQLMGQLGHVLEALDDEIESLLSEHGDGEVVISIDDDLADVPWAFLPALWNRPFSVLPTHRYLTSRPERLSTRSGISMLIGPGLRPVGSEVDRLRGTGGATSMRGVYSVYTIDQLSAAMDRRIVHIAAHGGPEPDNPLFNWLEFDCGRIFLHDLMFLDRVPQIIVLAACYAGQSQRLGAGGSASFANGFLGIGSRWVVSAGTALPDDTDLADTAAAVLGHLADGVDPPRALCLVRRSHGDRTASPAAIAFTCYGG